MVVLHDPVARRAALNDDTPIALTLSRRMPEERVGACVRGVMEHPVERGGVERAPLHVALDTPRELPTVGAEVVDDLAERSELGIEVENPENRFLHPAVRVFDPLPAHGFHIPNWGRANGLAVAGSGGFGGHQALRALAIVDGTEESLDFEAEAGHDVVRRRVAHHAVTADQGAGLAGGPEKDLEVDNVAAEARDVLDDDDDFDDELIDLDDEYDDVDQDDDRPSKPGQYDE